MPLDQQQKMSNGIQSRYVQLLIAQACQLEAISIPAVRPLRRLHPSALGIFRLIATNPLPSIIVRLYQTLAGEVAEWSKAHPC